MVSGHALYGTTEHPRADEPYDYIHLLIGLVVIAVIGAAGFLYWRRSQGNKK
jgi:hypothetical protein